MAEGFKGKYDEHMVGRNGADALARVCLVAALVLVVLSFFVVGVGPFVYLLVLLLGIACAVYAAFRMNSRNIAQRQSENEAFLGLFKRGNRQDRASREQRKPRGRASYGDEYFDEARGNAYDNGEYDDGYQSEPQPEPRPARERPQRDPQPQPAQEVPSVITISCENCGQRLNVPTGKGNIRVTCPRCSHQFTMMS
jgi:hypothetical protein